MKKKEVEKMIASWTVETCLKAPQKKAQLKKTIAKKIVSEIPTSKLEYFIEYMVGFGWLLQELKGAGVLINTSTAMDANEALEENRKGKPIWWHIAPTQKSYKTA